MCGGNGVCGGVPAWGIMAIVFICVSVVGAGVYMYMKRQHNALRDDIDTLLKQYLPLDGEQGAGNIQESERGLMAGEPSDDM